MRKYIFILLFNILLFGQEHFIVNIEPTGESTLFIFQDIITSLDAGDELGLFDLNGIIDNEGNFGELLVGSGIWDGSQLEIVAIMGVDLSQFGGPILPGAISGNSMILKIWESDSQIEYTANYTIEAGSGNFDDIFTVISAIECPPNSFADECGVCNGPGSIYECGCYDIPIGECDCNGNIEDCSGECGGTLEVDECGVCGGDNSSCEDCAGIPNGDSILDECGVCDGLGIVEGTCDCDGNILDCLGECAGGTLIDDCGICDGNGTQCDDSEVVLSFYDLGGSILTNITYENLISEVCLENVIMSSIGGTPLETSIGNCVSFSELSGTFPIYMKNTQSVAGFQFNITGLTIVGVSGGAAADAGFTISYSSSVILGFSFSGSSMEPSGDFWGCIDWNACNYNPWATIDDNSCEYPEEGYDCNGNCLNEDCLGECGGSAIVDECGVCNGPGATYECGCYDIPEGDCDCNGNINDCNDNCGGSAEEDCLGECNGNAVLDECGICEGPGPLYECDDGSFVCNELDCGNGGGDGGGGGTGEECENEGEIQDCFGNCGPASWLGDGYCDESMTDFNCLELAYDMGDCEIDFSNHIMPLISANCTGYCHSGGANYQGGLNLESYTGLMTGGNSGPAVIPYYPDYSLIIQKLYGTAPGAQMPYNLDPLPDNYIQTIYFWIEQGAIGEDDDGWEGGCVEEGLIEDCTGACVDENLLGDGNCDDGEDGEADFNCVELMFDYNEETSDMPDCPVGTLEFGNILYEQTNGTVEILMNCEFQVSDFEIELSGIIISDATGGTSEDANINVTVSDSIIQGTSTENSSYIPSNSGLLTVLNFNEIIADEICFENSTITTNIGITYAAVLGECIDVSMLDAYDNSPYNFIINNIYPNPFNPITTIEYNISEPSPVSLNIYDLYGRKIITLFENKIHSIGTYAFKWNAKDLSSGVYVLKIETPSLSDTRKVILAK